MLVTKGFFNQQHLGCQDLIKASKQSFLLPGLKIVQADSQHGPRFKTAVWFDFQVEENRIKAVLYLPV